ncbi:hypothetical protein AMECASPLE_013538 [Ameca splendens]|uniref:Uncharacterized protein n=1 Tax=Ameca splendens TaxID=208324 RepID=A0ABV0ZXR1_9TELE
MESIWYHNNPAKRGQPTKPHRPGKEAINQRGSTETKDSEASLAAILHHSIIKSQEEILTHFDSIPSKKGTKILIWNIRRARDGKTEIDFDSDSTDFRLPEIHLEELKQGLRNSASLRPEQNIPDMYYSLRVSQ